jgi:hypothetical protein
MANLLDGVLPEFEFGNRHAIVIDAPPEAVAAAIDQFRLETDAPWAMRMLFRLRGLRALRGSLRHSLASRGFTVLAETPGEEVVFGIAGKFWVMRELRHLVSLPDLAAFKSYRTPCAAKAAMNFCYQRLDGGRTRLTTETRVQCVDRAAYRWFRAYWLAIGPFSAWIRRDLLRAIQRKVAATRHHSSST